MRKDRGSLLDLYHYDARGSATNLVGAKNGSLYRAEENIYDAFGNKEEEIKQSTSSVVNDIKFTGATLDNSGTYYLGSRHYDPNTGRFLQQDTFKGDIYSPWTQNLYTYTSNNPVNYVDPTGHSLVATVAAIAGVVAAIAVATVAAPLVYTTTQVLVKGASKVVDWTKKRIKVEQAKFKDFIDTKLAEKWEEEVWKQETARRKAGKLIEAAERFRGTKIDELISPIPLSMPQKKYKDKDGRTYEVVYRVYGGTSKKYGRSWTPVDPRTVSKAEYRNLAGLPTSSEGGNTMQFIAVGLLVDDSGIVKRQALAFGKNKGGLASIPLCI